jgi:protein gp37
LSSTNTTIAWTDATWNPVTGCTKVSPGCDNCYAERIANQRRNVFPNGFNVTLHPGRLDEPKKWRKPSRVFANSMSDLFHRDVPEQFIYQVLDVIGACPQHQFQVLTKRPERALHVMRRYYETLAPNLCPFSNLWLGVSVEDCRRMARIGTLRQIPAAIRFISFEPWLGPLEAKDMPPVSYLEGIHWAILGAESGPGARPCPLDDLRALMWLARQAGAAVFVKQMGEHWARSQDPRPTKPDTGKFDSKGEVMDFWECEFRVQEWPQTVASADGPLFQGVDRG